VRPLILITNDDGIASPGLVAVAQAVHDLGDLLIVAPQHQQSSMGRSLPITFDGRLFPTTLHLNGHSWPAWGVNASPAGCAQIALLELAERRPALAISGINYGENIGCDLTISGTVGAAMEAASFGVRALAMSLQVEISHHFTYAESVDFSVAAYFTRYFAERWLRAEALPDVDLIKVEVPAQATPQTPWRVTRLERQRYWMPSTPQRAQPDGSVRVNYQVNAGNGWLPDSDATALHRGEVAVTPISLDNTSRIPPERVAAALNASRGD